MVVRTVAAAGPRISIIVALVAISIIVSGVGVVAADTAQAASGNDLPPPRENPFNSVSIANTCPLKGPHVQKVDDDEAVLEVIVDWLDQPESQYTLYFRYRKSGRITWKHSTKINPNDAAVNGFVIKQLTPGTTYKYQAVLEKPDGTICRTTVKEFTTEGDPPNENTGLLTGIIDALKNLPSSIVDSFKNFFRSLFQTIAQVIVDILTRVITSFPDPTNPHVREVHAVVFNIALVTATAMAVLIGLGSIFGLVNNPVKQILKLIAVLIIAALAPDLLYYPIELSRLATLALKPQTASFASVFQLTGLMLLALILDAFLLIGVVILFVVRDVYLLYFVAAAPLIGILWATPYLDRYAKQLIGIFVGFLILTPMEMIAFRMMLALLEIHGAEFPHWIYAMGGLVLMNLLPIFLMPRSVVAVGVAGAAAASGIDRAKESKHADRARHRVENVKTGVRNRYQEKRRRSADRFESLKDRWQDREQELSDNKFKTDNILDYDDE